MRCLSSKRVETNNGEPPLSVRQAIQMKQQLPRMVEPVVKKLWMWPADYVGQVHHVQDADRKISLRCVSTRPAAFVIKWFLTKNECKHVINVAHDSLTNAKIMLVDTDASAPPDFFRKTRNNKFTWLQHDSDEVIQNIAKRVAATLKVPEQAVFHSEALQVLHYSKSEHYYLHTDSSEHHPRFATLLFYLNKPKKGGYTAFPLAQTDRNNIGMAVKPCTGTALLFYNYLPDGTMDGDALHAAMDVVSGEKWAANQWLSLRALSSCLGEGSPSSSAGPSSSSSPSGSGPSSSITPSAPQQQRKGMKNNNGGEQVRYPNLKDYTEDEAAQSSSSAHFSPHSSPSAYLSNGTTTTTMSPHSPTGNRHGHASLGTPNALQGVTAPQFPTSTSRSHPNPHGPLTASGFSTTGSQLTSNTSITTHYPSNTKAGLTGTTIASNPTTKARPASPAQSPCPVSATSAHAMLAGCPSNVAFSNSKPRNLPNADEVSIRVHAPTNLNHHNHNHSLSNETDSVTYLQDVVTTWEAHHTTPTTGDQVPFVSTHQYSPLDALQSPLDLLTPDHTLGGTKHTTYQFTGNGPTPPPPSPTMAQ
eukprot:TRINITY_DN56297_c0_g1_i1.p1 TRINITY_DN56297_c0_g1~~TRINITY_DN56297_c0_g1_i1.p1  ORF type:complete len:587 (+),score=28.41 TRINITY_DN56297_c0_g1_i1:75-1835(+)